jgi:hypothetical protein
MSVGVSAAPEIADQLNPFVQDPANYFRYGAALVFQWNLDLLPRAAQMRQAEAKLEEMRATQRYALPDGFTLELLARLDNAADKAYAGSVIVNEANARFYEPGSPRAWLLSARLGRAF